MYLRIKAQILFVAFIPSWPCLLLQPHPPLLHVNFRKAGCLPACGSTELMYCFQLHAFPRTSWLHFCCGLIHLSDCFAPGNPPEPSVQVSRIQLFATPWTAARQASLYITSSWSLLKLMSIELVMPSNLLLLCHPLLLSSVFPSIRVFSMSQFFASGGQSIGASASVLPKNIQDWFPLGWTGWISFQFKELLRVFSNTTV